MEYVHKTIAEAAESMRQIKTSLLKRFKPGISPEMIEITNKQIDGVNLALEAPVYCCPYCGQALEMEAE